MDAADGLDGPQRPPTIPTGGRGADGHPTVTLGVPVYNGENYLRQMLDSLLGQTFSDFEIVVSDNGSTDATPAILAEFAERDQRVQVYTAVTNRGAGWNFNRVLELATGRFFKWQAHDDVLQPTYLQRCVEILEREPGVVLAHTAVDMVGADLRLIEHYGIRLATDDADPVVRFREMVLPWNLCFEVFGLIRRDVLARTPGMPSFSHGDGILLAHLALLGRFGFVDEPLFLSRQHAAQSMKQFGHEGGGNDYHAYAAWFDPNAAGKLQFPNWKILLEYQRVVMTCRAMGLRAIARCEWVLVRRARQDARLLLGDLRVAGRHIAGRLRRSGSAT